MKYQFQSTGNEIADKVIKEFDKQIRIEYKAAKGNKDLCPSYWYKLLFLDTKDLDIFEWREIRTEEYWENKKNLNEIDGIKYTLKCVINYKRLYY
jgi:hypothetical protein